MSSISVVVLLGPPGSGKGTQARNLTLKHPGWIQISTGDLFRSEISSGSELGVSVKDILSSGKLVSDDVTNKVFESQVKKLISKGNVKILLVDGFPRTAAQTNFLINFTKTAGALGAPLFVEFKISEATVISRVADRLVNPRTGRIYHKVTAPPKVSGMDDEDGSALIQRDDDKPETIRARFKLYESQLGGILSAMKGVGELTQIDAEGAPESVCKRLEEAILSSLKVETPH